MSKIMPIQFPMKGLNEYGSYDALGPSYATTATNVRPVGSGNGRMRGGQRDGLAKWTSAAVGSNAIRAIKQMSVSQSAGYVTVWNDPFDGQSDGDHLLARPDNYGDSVDPVYVYYKYARITGGKATSSVGASRVQMLLKSFDSDVIRVTGKFEVGTWVDSYGSPRGNVVVSMGDDGSYDDSPLLPKWRSVSIGAGGRNTGAANPAYLDWQFDNGTTLNSSTTLLGAPFTIGEIISFTILFEPDLITVTIAGHGTYTKTVPFGYGPFTNLTTNNGAIEFDGEVRYTAASGTTYSNYYDLQVEARRDALYSPRVVLVEGANIKTWNNGYTTPTNGTSAVVSSGEISVTQAYGEVFFADGSSTVKTYDPATDTVGTLTASAGTVPTQAQLAVLYNGRLVLTRIKNDPFNWFMSKVGDATNWDYADETSTGAVAGNDGLQAGLIGDIITAFIPHADDYALIGCPNSTFLMRGDPKAGGSINVVSGQVGIVGPKAWCQGPDGTIYFLSQNGLYRLPPGSSGTIDNLSGTRLAATLDAIDFSENTVELGWNLGDQSVYVCVRPADASAVTMIVWDSRTDSFWKDTYPAAMGPSAMGNIYFGDGANRLLLFGGYDSYLRSFNAASRTDDGTTITSRVRTAPFPLGDNPLQMSRIIDTRLNFGTSNFGTTDVTYNWYVGNDPLSVAVSATPTHSRVISQSTPVAADRSRILGAFASLELTNAVNDTKWAFEGGQIVVNPSGRIG